jgi:hypothetical protein
MTNPLAGGLVSLLDEHGVVEVHDPRAARAPATHGWRSRARSANGKTRFPQADAQLIDYGD